ncbi:MAG: MBOAT family protein [Oscillospiraceae bacterium]|nr:MBOAT family protein [Oscillospiraceae bacterium]
MLFSSVPYLFYFLVAVIIVYFIVPGKLKNLWLLIASLFFYGWGEPRFLILMVSSIVVGYVIGLLVEKFRGRGVSKLFLALAVVAAVATLLYFKYADFFISSFNAVTGLSVPLLHIALPIGVSFYTFQLLSYVIDVYRGEKAQKNPIRLATYIAMFPQLVAGPIVRYSDIARQLESRTHSFEKTALGVRRFIIGLSKKVLIANALGELCDVFQASGEQSVIFFWIYAVAFTLHIYFDFSGYSDMAIGLGKIFGFDFLENFNFPYISGSITEFWRRWHMSLGSWFRDYVYIPLGGSRVKKWRGLLNILIVWLLTGFWHGAAWNFVLWGLFFAVLLTVEKLGLLKLLEKTRVIKHIYVMFFVIVGFVLFNAASPAEWVSCLGGMFGAGGLPGVSSEAIYYLRSYGLVFIIGIIGSTPLVKRAVFAIKAGEKGAKAINVLEPIVLAVLALLCAAYLVDGSFNPFLYFRF